MSKPACLSASRAGLAETADDSEGPHGPGVSGQQNRKNEKLWGALWPTPRDWRLAVQDLVTGLQSWNLWLLLGISDIRQRYKRSRFGQFWITLSMGVFIAGLGIVYSTLFRQPVHDYIPYLAINVTVWTLVAGTIGESAAVFTQASIYLRQDAIQRTVFVMRLLVRNLVIFAHNLVIVPLAFAILLVAPSPMIAMAVPGLALDLVVLFLITLILGVLSTRFRDLPQIIQNALQLLFFITPVMWKADQIAGRKGAILLLNPFASMLRIVTEPMLGRASPPSAYLMTACFGLLLALMALPLFARFRARLVYWL